MKSEPQWLPKDLVVAMHRKLIQRYGGLYAVRDETLLESALAKPQQRFHYEDAADIFELTASLGFGLAKNHPFADGNKRIAFAAMAVFLQMNGYEITADEVEAVATILRLVEGSCSESELADWPKTNHKKIK